MTDNSMVFDFRADGTSRWRMPGDTWVGFARWQLVGCSARGGTIGGRMYAQVPRDRTGKGARAGHAVVAKPENHRHGAGGGMEQAANRNAEVILEPSLTDITC